MILLSPHFTVAEMIRSDVATRNEIDNTPSQPMLENLKVLAAGLERVRDVLGRPVYISSGYRCEALERAITKRSYEAWCRRKGKLITEASWQEYFSKKAHPKGLAADFECPGAGNPEQVFGILKAYKYQIDFDQLILEFPPNGWVHIGFSHTRPSRGQLLEFRGDRYETVT